MFVSATAIDHSGGAHAVGAGDAASASVALDIGAGKGALVIYPHERYRGLEIELSRADGDGRRTHTGVHDRPTGVGSVLTAIFGSLPVGDYVIWRDAATSGPVITIADGEVAELTLD
jgi:hypothetical protein